MAKSPVTSLSHRFTEAVEYARALHTETRKGTCIPYMAHLLGVAALVLGENGELEFPVTEDMAIAALLHDAAEDKGGEVRLHDIRLRFGAEVERMVRDCSDAIVSEQTEKQEWWARKARYIRALAGHHRDSLIIVAADKLYNARTMLEDYRQIGEELWPRFKHGATDQLWYFNSVVDVLRATGTNRMVEELARTVAELAGAVETNGQAGSSRLRRRQYVASALTVPSSRKERLDKRRHY